MAIEVPYMMGTVLVFCVILYPMVGFQFTAVRFLWFILFITLSFMYYTLYGMMCVALTPNIEMAGGLSFFVFMLWNVFSGFIISRKVNFRHL
jgi:ABC-2 type transporter